MSGNEDEFGLPVKTPFSTAVEARAHLLKHSRKVIDTAAKLATGRLSAVSYRGDIDVLRQYLAIVGKLKTADDPIVIPPKVLKKLHDQPENCQPRLEEVFMAFLDGDIPLSQLKSVLEGFSYLFEVTEIREISSLLREQKTKFGRK
jgi:hypothetical protein